MSEKTIPTLDALPKWAQPLVNEACASIPPDMRQEFLADFEAMQNLTTGNPAVYANLIGIVKRLAAPAVMPLSRIALAGSVNVGKSTLFNAMLPESNEHAEVSSVPGTTKENQVAQMGIFNLVDTPGMDHGADAGTQERRQAARACEDSDFIIVVFDATRGVTTSDMELFNYVKSLDIPYAIAVNKMDAVSKKEQPKILQSCALTLGVEVDALCPISAEKRQGVERLLLTAAANEPRLLGALGKQLPQLREKLSWQAIRRAGIASCAVALAPIPIVDFIPLTAIQVTMLMTLGRIYNKPLSKARALELLGSFGMGLLGRALVQEIAKLGGPPGWAVSASVATGITIAIGYSCIAWFDRGTAPDPAAMKELAQKLPKLVLEHLKSFKKKRPSKEKLEEQLQAPLEKITRELSTGELNVELPQEDEIK